MGTQEEEYWRYGYAHGYADADAEYNSPTCKGYDHGIMNSPPEDPYAEGYRDRWTGRPNRTATEQPARTSYPQRENTK